MVKGIHDYYSQLIHEYEKLHDEDLINLLAHDIEENSDEFTLDQKMNEP